MRLCYELSKCPSYNVLNLNSKASTKEHEGIIFFLFPNQNISCGYSKEPSQSDGSFEHPKHKFKMLGKKLMSIKRLMSLLLLGLCNVAKFFFTYRT